MNKHTVFVAGKHFVLLSDDKSEYVEKIAEAVGNKISEISTVNPALDRRAAAILCALDYADDLHKETARNKSLSEKAQPLISQADRQAKQLKDLNEKLAEKDREISRIQKELDDLRAAFEKSTRVLDGSGSVKPETPQNHHQSNNKKHNKGYKPMRQYSLFDNDQQD